MQVVNTTRHDFKSIKDARSWAKKNIAGVYKNEDTQKNIHISKTSIDKYLSESAVRKSISLDMHLSTLKVLPKLVETSVLKEVQQDKEGNKDIKEIERFYGTIKCRGQLYPVKITVKVYPTGVNNAYSYEVLRIESPVVTNELPGRSIQSEHS